jgi:hypothetical protein
MSYIPLARFVVGKIDLSSGPTKTALFAVDVPGEVMKLR